MPFHPCLFLKGSKRKFSPILISSLAWGHCSSYTAGEKPGGAITCPSLPFLIHTLFVKKAALIENMSAWKRTRVMILLHSGSLQERTGLALLKCLPPRAGCCLCSVQSCSYAQHPSTSCSQWFSCFVAVPAEIISAKIPLKDRFLMKVKQGMRKGTDLHALCRDLHYSQGAHQSTGFSHSEQWRNLQVLLLHLLFLRLSKLMLS